MIVGANKQWQYMEEDTQLLLPWYTLPCLEWLKKQNTKSWNVFEFGAGYSTIWWRLNCNRLLSVDTNESWAKAMNAHFINDKNEYSTSLIRHASSMESLRQEDFLINCIIIDGAWRLECLQNSLDIVVSGGYIIIDNWGQEDFPYTKEAEELLVGWEKQLFKQPNHSRWVTAVFRKPL